MLTYLGSQTFGTVVPLLTTSLAAFLATLVGEIAGLQSDAVALAADIANLQGDQAQLASELADPLGLAQSIIDQLAGGPARIIQGIEAAIANVTSGAALIALGQSLLAGPAIILASLASALAQVQAKIAALEARIAAMISRIASIVARAEALAARILALQNMQGIVSGWQSLLGVAGVHLYRYSGSVSNMGSEIASQTSSGLPGGAPSDVADGLLIVGTAPGFFTALAQILRVA